MSEEDDPLRFMRRRLDALRRRHLVRQVRPLQHGAEPWIEVEGRRMLNLSSNNYLGLATHPDVVAAAGAVTAAGSGSARLVAGDMPEHRALEQRLAIFKGTERALLFGSGYAANVGIIPALVGSGDLVVGDELNHASLIDGCRLSGAEFQTHRHHDVVDLDKVLSAAIRGRKLVVTDTVFSMDGDVAPLTEITRICRHHGAMLLVDEAHATGCVGPGGRGLVAALGLEGQVTVIVGTLGKALGSSGAYAAGSNLVIEYLTNTARSFIFSTALPPGVVAAARVALEILEREPERVEVLQRLARRLRSGLQALGFNTLDSSTQIVPVLAGGSDTALWMAASLRDAGVYTVAIRPPTVPMGAARIRASLMALHTDVDVDRAVEAFDRVRKPSAP